MTPSYVGLYQSISASFDRFFSGFSHSIGARHVALAHDLAWGVLLSGSTLISEIARALSAEGGPDLMTAEKRFSRGLAGKAWRDDRLADALVRHNSQGMHDRDLVVVDLTDLAKPCARKMDDLCFVRDGSRHELSPGYWAVTVFREVQPHRLLPLALDPFSTRARGFVSQNEVIFSTLRRVRRGLPQGRIGVMLEDRGFDGDEFFRFAVREAWPFIVRLRGDRHVVGPWGRLSAERVAATYLDAAPRTGRERAAIVPVKLPDVPGWFHLVGHETLGHAEPLVLLVYELGARARAGALEYAHMYLRRWGGEDWIRLVKQGLGLEKFMARSAPARARLSLAVEMALTFAVEADASSEPRSGATCAPWVEEVKALAQSFDEEVKSEVSRLMRGIRALARATRGERERRAA